MLDVSQDRLVPRLLGREQFLGNRSPPIAPLLPHRQERVHELRKQIAQGLAVLGGERVEVHQGPDPIGNAVRDARNDHPPVAVAAQDDFAEILEHDRRHHVVDVVREGDLRRADMLALTKARERGRERLVPVIPELPGDGSPLPTASPSPVHDHECRHVSTSGSGSAVRTR